MTSKPKTTDIVGRLREGRTDGTALRWSVTPVHIEAANEIERLRAEVHDLGRLSDTCTYHALGKVCSYCECKRKARKNSP